MKPSLLIPLMLLVVVVAFATVQVTNRFNQPRSIVVRVTDGPTVLSTQLIPLDGR